MDEKNIFSETGQPALQYENVIMKESKLPVNVFFRTNNSDSTGCRLHWHEELEFYYVISGEVSLLCNGTKTLLRPGDVGFVNWCEPHRGNRFSDGAKHYIIQIGTEFFADEVISFSVPGQTENEKCNLLSLLSSQNRNFPNVISECPELTRLLENIIEEFGEKLPGYEMKIKAAVFNILVLLLRKADFSLKDYSIRTKDMMTLEHLKKILVFLPGHCTNPEEVSLPALSRRFGLSVPYLCRIFKKHTNLTLTAYINELRCSKAASLIQDGVPLEKTAVMTGFHDYNYFSRLFKKTMGSTPSEYRKKKK